MDLIKTRQALGLMSSSALEGVQAALIETDGVDVYSSGPSEIYPYDDVLRERLRSLYGRKQGEGYDELISEVGREFTQFNAAVVEDFATSYAVEPEIIGFHGHTVEHIPSERYILQIGDGNLLARLAGIPVVNHFRQADLAAGGQGAPLTPIYFNALASKADLPRPLVILNISGISTISWFGTNGEMLAFDCAPGNVAINDWVLRHGGMHMDYNGRLAITGSVNNHVLSSLMHHKYLGKYPPKAMDRNLFKEKLEHLEGLSLADGAATATAFVAEAIAYSLAMYVPEMPGEMIVIGGGAANPTLLRFLRQRLEKVEIKTGADLGWNIDAVEAQAFAYLAVRRANLMPASYPSTTGVAEPIICGEICEP